MGHAIRGVSASAAGLTGASEVVAKTKFDAGECASLLQFLHVRNGGRIAKRTLAL
jgi:hypothetical protein